MARQAGRSGRGLVQRGRPRVRRLARLHGHRPRELSMCSPRRPEWTSIRPRFPPAAPRAPHSPGSPRSSTGSTTGRRSTSMSTPRSSGTPADGSSRRLAAAAVLAGPPDGCPTRRGGSMSPTLIRRVPAAPRDQRLATRVERSDKPHHHRSRGIVTELVLALHPSGPGALHIRCRATQE